MCPSPKVVAWLLETSEPSIRYWSLTKLLGRPESDIEVQNTRRVIMNRGPATVILSHYDHDTVRPCFHGNLVGYLHSLGQAQDSRVGVFESEPASSGIRSQWRCPINDNKPSTWGAARALWGFCRMTPARRTRTIQDAMSSAIDLLASHWLGLADCPGDPPRHRLWDRLTFPLFYQADVLFILRTLADLEWLDTVPNASDALLWLEEKGRGNGQWNGRCPYTMRMWTQLENHRRPSKWIAWQSLYVLAHAHG